MQRLPDFVNRTVQSTLIDQGKRRLCPPLHSVRSRFARPHYVPRRAQPKKSAVELCSASCFFLPPCSVIMRGKVSQLHWHRGGRSAASTVKESPVRTPPESTVSNTATVHKR